MKNDFIVIANGQILSESRLREAFYKFTETELSNSNYTVICADGGWLNAKKLDLSIDYLIGDLDSIPPTLKQDLELRNKNITNPEATCEFNFQELTENDLPAANSKKGTKIFYDPDQNKTDTRLALELAHKLQAKHVFLLAASGGRLDHLLSNIFELKYMHDYMDIKLIDEFTELTYINKSSDYTGEIGDVLSVMPISDVKSLSYEGLLYSLGQENIKAGTSLVSNKFSAKKARIFFESGELLVMRTYD